MGFYDVEITFEAMQLAHGKLHLQPNEIASHIAANIMHDIPSGIYIDGIINELTEFIDELDAIKNKIK